MAQRRGSGGVDPPTKLGGYWLGREQPGGNVYRYWYDERTGRVSRKSLKTKAWSEAQEILAAIAFSKPRQRRFGPVADPGEVALIAVLDHYLEHRASKIRTGDQASRAIELLEQYLFDVRKLPETAKADSFGLDLQQDYVRWLARTYGHSSAYIARIMNPVAAAMHFAAEEQAIEDESGETRSVRLMGSAPKVRFYAEWIAEKAAIAPPQKRDWIPTIEEMARFIDAIGPEHAFRYAVIALNTWARPEAILEIDFKRQVRDGGLLDLNPVNRAQTKKRRPIIRLTRNLAAWVAEWKAAHPLIWREEAVGSIKKAVELANARWMLSEAGWHPEKQEPLFARGGDKARFAAVRQLADNGGHRITPRTFRSFMATRVRNQREILAEDLREQRRVWLGHLDQDTTARYEIMDPDYLRECAAATDLIIDKIGQLTRKRAMWPAGTGAELPAIRVVK